MHEEQVILGNDVLLKCNIPSFEADFVSVASWVDSEGLTFPVNQNYGNFSPEDMTINTHMRITYYTIKGTTISCQRRHMQIILPLSSFYITTLEPIYTNLQHGLFFLLVSLILPIFSVAIQPYRVVVPEEQVILGNDVFLKCNIPSFEADFVSVSSWVDSEGTSFSVDKNYGNFH